MPDPVTGAVVGAVALAKAMDPGGPEAEKVASNLLTRLFGPSVDVLGEALARSVEYRTRNFGRIVQKANAKSQGSRDGIVNTRVALVMLEEGSLCDDELMAEYLGGMLAGARTFNGKDDRAVSWIKIIAGLSSFQVRAHYLLYREWADRLNGRTDLKIGMGVAAFRATLDVEFNKFDQALNVDDSVSSGEATAHAILGLQAINLLGHNSVCGPRAEVAPDSPFEEVLQVEPSIRGCELYGWAQGLPGLNASEFTSKARVFDSEPAIPRLEKVALTRL
jgi:hypothetical protein